MQTTWKTISNKTKPLTFLLSLTFLFLSPSVSFSQTFKCEFIAEKFKGGKSNKATCGGDPELTFSTKYNQLPRHQHCEIDTVTYYDDYIDFIVDTKDLMVTYTIKHGVTSFGIDGMVQHHKIKGDMNEKEVRETYGKIHIREKKGLIVNVQTFSQTVNHNKDNNYLGEETTSYLITYRLFPSGVISLYIPQGGKSILSENSTSEGKHGHNSWVSMKFGKCVNTSN